MDTIINPFVWNNTHAFVFDEDLEYEWEQRSDAANDIRIDPSQAAIAGVSWNAVAISFSPGFDFAQPLMSKIIELLGSSGRWLQREARLQLRQLHAGQPVRAPAAGQARVGAVHRP